MDLTEAEDFEKRWWEYTEELYKKKKKNPNYPGNHDGVITDLEADILECKVKCKASGDDKIPAELFQILKDNAVKILHSTCQQIWKTQQWPQGWKKFSFQSQRKVMPKNFQTTTQLHSSHTLANNAQISPNEASTVHELRTSRCSSWDLEKAEEPEIKLPTSIGS